MKKTRILNRLKEIHEKNHLPGDGIKFEVDELLHLLIVDIQNEPMKPLDWSKLAHAQGFVPILSLSKGILTHYFNLPGMENEKVVGMINTYFNIEDVRAIADQLDFTLDIEGIREEVLLHLDEHYPFWNIEQDEEPF